MHHCLAIPEIQTIVFSFFRPVFDEDIEDNDSNDREAEVVACMGTLATLARTCRAFTEPALDILWHNQPTLGPLVRVMPPDLWDLVDDGSDSERTLTFVRDPNDSDWERFDHYARKIYNYGFFRLTSSWDVHKDVVRTLASYRPARLFLPNLQGFSFSTDEELNPTARKTLPMIQCLLNSNITRVVLSLRTDEYETEGLLIALCRICPKIQTLGITLPAKPSPALIAATHTLVCRLHHLRQIHIPGWPPVWDALHHCSILSYLCIYKAGELRPDTIQRLKSNTLMKDRFPSLQNLSFRSETWEMASITLDAIHRPFTSLVVAALQDKQASPMSIKFLHTLSRHQCHASLLHLHLTSLWPSYPNDHEPSRSDMEALFLLPAITTLYLFDTLAIFIDDAWLAKAAVAWPHLKKLRIHRMTRTTLAGLAPLVRLCRSLVTLNVIAVWRPFDPRSLDPATSNLLVEVISVKGAEIVGETLAMLRCLTAMFPKLRKIRFSKEGVMSVRWQQLQAALDKSLRF